MGLVTSSQVLRYLCFNKVVTIYPPCTCLPDLLVIFSLRTTTLRARMWQVLGNAGSKASATDADPPETAKTRAALIDLAKQAERKMDQRGRPHACGIYTLVDEVRRGATGRRESCSTLPPVGGRGTLAFA
jgi:hypothetical protein